MLANAVPVPQTWVPPMYQWTSGDKGTAYLLQLLGIRMLSGTWYLSPSAFSSEILAGEI